MTTLKGWINAETDKALLFEPIAEAPLPEGWIPLSQISKIVRLTDGTATVTMEDWIAKKRGWLEDSVDDEEEHNLDKYHDLDGYGRDN